MTAIVELDHATIKLGGRSILADASLTIQAGEFIGVLGPNGAGKTTLMRAILGLLPPSAGSLRVFGRTPQRGNTDIGYLPQVRTVLPDLRVRGVDFIGSSLHGECWGLPSLSRHDRSMIEETLEAVGARELGHRPLSEMSGGERQRLLLAQAVLGQPKLLLLDEPLISLDARHQEIAIDVVRGFPERVARRPERYAMPPGKSVADVKAELENVLASELATRKFAYTRTDGSSWTLSLKDVIDRAGQFEMAYNPNDCVELRWGAAENSQEAATCRRHAAQEQRGKMIKYRTWFRERQWPVGA